MTVKDFLKFDIEINHSEHFTDIEFSSENTLFEINEIVDTGVRTDFGYATSVYLGTPLKFIPKSYKVYDKNYNRIKYDRQRLA